MCITPPPTAEAQFSTKAPAGLRTIEVNDRRDLCLAVGHSRTYVQCESVAHRLHGRTMTT